MAELTTSRVSVQVVPPTVLGTVYTFDKCELPRNSDFWAVYENQSQVSGQGITALNVQDSLDGTTYANIAASAPGATIVAQGRKTVKFSTRPGAPFVRVQATGSAVGIPLRLTFHRVDGGHVLGVVGNYF